MFLGELGRQVLVAVIAVSRAIGRVVVEVGGEGWRHGGLGESRRVGRRLRPQLGEVQIGPCAVAEIHRLVELPLGPEPVEDDPVEGDDDDFDDDFDDGADQRPSLESPSVVPPAACQSRTPLTCSRQIRS